MRLKLLRRLFFGAAAGMVVGLLLLAVEGALILRPGAIGVGVEVQGPLLALIRATKPLLPGLLLRVAIVYIAAGALLGAMSSLLASCLPVRRRGVPGGADRACGS